jgi:hypothetical protein
VILIDHIPLAFLKEAFELDFDEAIDVVIRIGGYTKNLFSSEIAPFPEYRIQELRKSFALNKAMPDDLRDLSSIMVPKEIAVQLLTDSGYTQKKSKKAFRLDGGRPCKVFHLTLCATRT